MEISGLLFFILFLVSLSYSSNNGMPLPLLQLKLIFIIDFRLGVLAGQPTHPLSGGRKIRPDDEAGKPRVVAPFLSCSPTEDGYHEIVLLGCHCFTISGTGCQF